MPPIGDPDMDEWNLVYCQCGSEEWSDSSHLAWIGEEFLRNAPGIGTAIGLWGLGSGNDALSGRGLAPWERVIGALPGGRYAKWLRPSVSALRFTDEAVDTGRTMPGVATKFAKHADDFHELGITTEEAFEANAMRLAAQVDQTDDILIGIRPRDGTKIVYERSTNTIVFEHPGGVIGTQFRPGPGEAYFWKEIR